MKGDHTWAGYMAENLRDPEYARAHAIGKPFANLALNVWALREAAGLTQAELANRAGMKQPRIADIERDASNPTLETISRIALALGVSADQLLAEPVEATLATARGAVERRAGLTPPAAAASVPTAGRRRRIA